MTNLQETLADLPENKIHDLEVITQRIVDTGKAEMVILFGSYARGDYKEKRGLDQGKQSDFDILVVVPDYEAEKKLRISLKGKFTDISVPVQVIVEEIGYVNSSLIEKQYFFTDIKREGKILYNSTRFELSEPKEITPTKRRETAEEDLRNWFGQASDFWDDFNTKYQKLNLESIRYRKCSFFLQQTVEMCYTTIEMVYTHYNPYEHNLETLRERTLKFDSRIKDVLPYETEEQIELFDYLNFAYIGGRYRSEEEFPVTKEQLDYWGAETKKLLELTEQICKEKIEQLKEVEKAAR